jgi:shikimate dehydrogenase
VPVKRVALLGYPVGHSRSPAMQNAAFEALGMDWRYEALEVEPDRFAALVRELPDRGFAGANVTIPHKLLALAIADTVSDVAQAVGAVNTLVFESGRIVGENTDVGGFIAALHERAPAAPAGMRALVLGAGGAARAVVYALTAEGADRVEVWNRTPERAVALVEDLAPKLHGGRISVTSEPSRSSFDLLVNATSVGMEGAEPDSAGGAPGFKQLPIPADKWGDAAIVADLVYGDGGTALTRKARAAGITCVEGMDILVHQGAASFERWTGVRAPVEVMRRGARKR